MNHGVYVAKPGTAIQHNTSAVQPDLCHQRVAPSADSMLANGFMTRIQDILPTGPEEIGSSPSIQMSGTGVTGSEGAPSPPTSASLRIRLRPREAMWYC